jgi:integrase
MNERIRLVDGDEITIPSFTTDVTGHPVDLRPLKWRLNSVEQSTTSMNWGLLTGCDDGAISALKAHIIRLIETKSPAYAKASFQFIGAFLKALREASSPTPTVTLKSLVWYLERLREIRNGYQFHHIRHWYVSSADRFVDGFDDDVVFALNDLRIEGNAKGFAVLSADPEAGPLTEFEEAALRRALIRDEGPIEQRAALWLAFAFGTNPANLALLREEDFEINEFADGTPTAYFLNIPRIKKRLPPRTEFKKRYVDQPLAVIIKELIERNARIAKNDVIRPLFRLETARTTLVGGPLEEFAFHPTASRVTQLIAQCVERLGVVSPRTEKTLAVTTRRLRYTYASKMVRQGIAARDLAELLDHTDLQNVQVYYKASSRFVERLDTTTAKHIGPIVRAFMGEIVERKDVTIDLIPFRDLPDLGQCGASFACGLSPHKNCYTCTKFKAFKDGPHEAVLISLIEERNQLLGDGYERIAEQLDETILAVGEVVSKTQGDAA